MSANRPIQHWRGKTVWLIGASTGIGRALALALADQGARVFVSARNSSALISLATERSLISALPLDVVDAQALVDAAAHIAQTSPAPLDWVCYCAGTYKAHDALWFDLPDLLHHQQVNYVGALHALAAVIPSMIKAKHGHISLVGSVAGYVGLPKALAYGPTKAALNNLAQSLYLDLHPLGVGVSVINPGFVQTPLTAQNAFKMPALISPTKAADHILQGLRRGQFEIHFPKRFTLWLKLLRLLPYAWQFALLRKVKYG